MRILNRPPASLPMWGMLMYGAVALAVTYLLGFIFPTLQNPISLAVVALGAATIPLWWLPTRLKWDSLAIVGVVLIAVLGVLLLIAPTYIVR